MEAIDRLEPKQPQGRANPIYAYVGVGRVLIAQAHAAEALPLLKRALEMSREEFPRPTGGPPTPSWPSGPA